MALTNIAYKIHYTCGKDIKPSYDLIYDNQNLTYYGSQLTYHKSSSESFLPLGRDGDYFEVSGYTNIEEMRSLGIGMQVVLVFETPTTLVHSENLILPEDKNIHTNPHHAYRFIEYDTGKWKMLVSDTISSTYDTSAVHVDTSNEINLINSKESIKLDDAFIIEDSEDNWNKKKFSGYQIARTGREGMIGSNSDYNRSNYLYEDFPEGFILERFSHVGVPFIFNDIFAVYSNVYLSGYIEYNPNKDPIIGDFYAESSGSISTHSFSGGTGNLGSFDIIVNSELPITLYTIEKTIDNTEKFILKLSDNDNYQRISIGTFPSVNENPSCLIFCENYYNILIGTDGGRILKGGGSPWNVMYTGGASITIKEIIKIGSSSFIALLFDSDTNKCSLLKTNDNGGNWNITASDLPDLKTICFSFQNYIIGLSDKEIYLFKDNKDNFNSILTVTDETFKTIHYLGNGIIFVAGHQIGVSYDLWFSYDFGSTWRHSKINNPYEMVSTSYSTYIDGIYLLLRDTPTSNTILFIPSTQQFYDFGVSFLKEKDTDPTAIHTDNRAEILHIEPKTDPIGSDIIVIEDSQSASFVTLKYNGFILQYNGDTLIYPDITESFQKKSVALMNLDLPGIDSMAYHSDLPGEYVTARQGQKLSPVGADRLIIEDSESGWIKKFIEIDDIPANNVDPTAIHLDSTSPEIGTLSFDSILPEDVLVIEKADGTKRKLAFSSIPTAHDADAIHRSVPNEISLIDELITPDNDDYVLIEINNPTEGNRIKKKVKLANLPTAGGGEVNYGINSGTGSIAWYDGKDGSGLKFRTLNVDQNTGLDWVFQDGHYTLSIAKESLKTFLNLDLDEIADGEDYVKITYMEKALIYSASLAAAAALGLAAGTERWIQWKGDPLKNTVEQDLIPDVNHLMSRRIDNIHFMGDAGIEPLFYRQNDHSLNVSKLADGNTVHVVLGADGGISFETKYQNSDQIVFKESGGEQKLFLNFDSNFLHVFPLSEVGNPNTVYWSDQDYEKPMHGYYFWAPSVTKRGNTEEENRLYLGGVYSSSLEYGEGQKKFRIAARRKLHTVPNNQASITIYATSIADLVTALDKEENGQQTQIQSLLADTQNETINETNPQVIRVRHWVNELEKENNDNTEYKKNTKAKTAYKGLKITLKVIGIAIAIAGLLKDESDPEKAYSTYGGIVEETEDDAGYRIIRNIQPKNVAIGEYALTSTLVKTGQYDHDTIQLRFDSTKIRRLGIQDHFLNMGGNLIYGCMPVPWNYTQYTGVMPTLYDIKNNYPIFIYDKANQFIPNMPRKIIPSPSDLIVIEDSKSDPLYKKKYITFDSIKAALALSSRIFSEPIADPVSIRWKDDLKFDDSNPSVTLSDMEPNKGGIVDFLTDYFKKFISFPKSELLQDGLWDKFYVYFQSTIDDDLFEFEVPLVNGTTDYDAACSQSGIFYIINKTLNSEKFITVFFEENEGLKEKSIIRKNIKNLLSSGYEFTQYNIGEFTPNEELNIITWTHDTDKMLIGTYCEEVAYNTCRILKGSLGSYETVYEVYISGTGGFVSIDFIAPNTCIATYHYFTAIATSHLLISYDNGSTWQSYSIVERYIDKLLLINDTNIIARENNKIYISFDKGLTFEEAPVWENSGYIINDIIYLGYNVAIIGGGTGSNYPFISITYDGGLTWKDIIFDSLDMGSFDDIAYEPENNILSCFGSLKSDPNIIDVYNCYLPDIEGVEDNFAFHLDENNEIDSLDEKVAISPDDLFLIEDSSDNYQKKKVNAKNIINPQLNFNYKSIMAGYNNKYAACTLDSWPIVNFKYQLLLSFLSINFFEMVGDVQILGGHIQDVHSMVSFYYRMNEHSGYVKVTLGHLASGSPGLTHFTCTPEGYCYFAQRGLDEFAGNDNYTINVRHIATLSSFSFLIELPIKNRPFYVSSMINYPNDGGKIIVATSKVEPETREEEGKVEIYNVFREDTYYLWTKIFEKSMPSGYTFTPSIMAINDNKISFIVSYYKTYPIEDPIIRRTYLYELQIDTGTLTELSIFEHAVLDKCIYIGNGRYIAIANYIGETESEAPGIFISLDGGSTWQDAYRNMEFYFTDIEYIGYNSIIATASSSYGNPASVLFSFDGGLTWQEYKYLFWESQYPIENPNNICIHGNSKRIYMTTSFQSYQNDTIIYTQI